MIFPRGKDETDEEYQREFFQAFVVCNLLILAGIAIALIV